MKIHNYGNDYAQAWKFKGVENDRNRNTRHNESATSREVRTKDTGNIETKEEAKPKKENKKKENNNTDKV